MSDPDVSALFPGKRPAWQAWFGIVIFGPGSPLRWAKVHFFKWNGGRGFPLAAVEGFTGSTEAMVALGRPDHVEVVRSFSNSGRLEITPSRISQGDIFSLKRPDGRKCEMELLLEEGNAQASLCFEPGWPIRWARFGSILTYTGFHSLVTASLSLDGELIESDGFGILEHVTGAKLPFDFTRVLPASFHWDVVVFPGDSLESSAMLSLGLGMRKLKKFKGRAMLPGGRPSSMARGSVDYLETRGEQGPHGEPYAFPTVWRSGFRAGGQQFSFTAGANTPPAPVIPGGAMMGFDFEGEVEKDGRARPVSGWGFTEYGDFSGRLARDILLNSQSKT